MEIEGFKEFLQNKSLDSERIEKSLSTLKEFENFLIKSNRSIKKINQDDLHNFSTYLIENKMNSYENYLSLLRYGYFINNKELIIASMELLDGSEMITNFWRIITEEFGEEVRNEIFEDSEVPPLGLHPKKKPEITKKLVNRFIMKFGEEKSREFFEIGLRDKYTESYKNPRKTFLETNNIDIFLDQKRQKFLRTLESHLKNESLFFTQEINSDVIDYIKKDPTIESGIRDGNVVIITKIPYNTIPYLNSSDEKEKRFYFCHNPWIREALLEEDQPISPIFCNCSGGYYKNYWEAVLNHHPLKVELLESVIKGDSVCRFALYLPQDIVNATQE